MGSVTPLDVSAAGTEDAAFEDFYRQYYVRVLVLIRRHFRTCEAEEVAQETMTRCFTHFAGIDATRDPWPWVASIARNTAIDTMRRGRWNAPVDEVPDSAADVADDPPYDALLARERRRSLARALRELRPADRRIIEDHDLEGVACVELAAMRDLTPNAVRQQLHRARRRLATELRRAGGAFGVVGLAVHERLARAARRLDDFTAAAGTAATTFGIVAAATFATSVAGALGGSAQAAAPVTASRVPYVAGTATPAASESLRGTRGEPRTVRPVRATATATTTVPSGPAALPTVATKGDPVNRPDESNSQVIRIHNPVDGSDIVIHHNGENTPGYVFVCSTVGGCPAI